MARTSPAWLSTGWEKSERRWASCFSMRRFTIRSRSQENVAFPLEHHRRDMSKSERDDRVKQLLAEVGMEGDSR